VEVEKKKNSTLKALHPGMLVRLRKFYLSVYAVAIDEIESQKHYYSLYGTEKLFPLFTNDIYVVIEERKFNSQTTTTSLVKFMRNNGQVGWTLRKNLGIF
jgi:hypothetical protein